MEQDIYRTIGCSQSVPLRTFAFPWYVPCCKHEHVRPCGPVPGNPPKDDPYYEPICACGCSGYDERCGGGEWWLPAPTMDQLLDNTIFKSV